jgi:hypothetical protein
MICGYQVRIQRRDIHVGSTGLCCIMLCVYQVRIQTRDIQDRKYMARQDNATWASCVNTEERYTG